MDRKIITDALEIIPILINGYNKNANVLNAAKRKVYAYARYIGTIDDAEKTRQLSLMLNHEHVYVKYWGGVIALSYNVMKKTSLSYLDFYIRHRNNSVKRRCKFSTESSIKSS